MKNESVTRSTALSTVVSITFIILFEIGQSGRTEKPTETITRSNKHKIKFTADGLKEEVRERGRSFVAVVLVFSFTSNQR